MDARVPAAGDSIEKRFDIWLTVAVINLAGRAEVSTEELRRYDQIGAVAADVAVERFFQADRAVTRLDIDLAQNRAACLHGVNFDLSHAALRVAAVAELNHRQIWDREREDVDLTRLRRPGFAASGAVEVTVPHVHHSHILSMPASVLVVAVVRPFPRSGAHQRPVMTLCFVRIAFLGANRTACFVTAGSGGFDAMVLTPIDMAAVELEKPVVPIAIRICADQCSTNGLRCRGTTRVNTVWTFGFVAEHNADAF